MTRREVTDGGDGETLAVFRISVLAVIVPQMFKQLSDGVLVVADEVGVRGDVVAIPMCTHTEREKG